MDRLFWICLGGALGTAARYLVGLWTAQRLGQAFPHGTVLVNLTGCFLIAALAHAAAVHAWPANLRLAVSVGFLGGYTTYSSFNQDTMRLLEEGATAAAAANVLLTVLGGLAAGLLGLTAARQLLGR